MRRLFFGLVAGGLLAVSGCGTPGYVKASAIEGTLLRVADRHDAYTKDDQALSETQERVNLRDTELLRKLLAEAQQPTEGEE